MTLAISTTTVVEATAVRVGEEAVITLANIVKGEERTIEKRHFRESFNATPQTDNEWNANIKREIDALVVQLNAVAPSEVDIKSAIS